MKTIFLGLSLLLVSVLANSSEGKVEEDEGYEFPEHKAVVRVKRWSKTLPRGQKRPKREIAGNDHEVVIEEFDDTPIDNLPKMRSRRWSKTHKRGERPKRADSQPQPIIPGPPQPPLPPPGNMAPSLAAAPQSETKEVPADPQPLANPNDNKPDQLAETQAPTKSSLKSKGLPPPSHPQPIQPIRPKRQLDNSKEPSYHNKMVQTPQTRAKRQALFDTFNRVKRQIA